VLINELQEDATRNKKILDKTKESVNELLGDAAGSKKPADNILESITDLPGDETIILPQKRKVDHSDEMELKRDGSADGPAGFALFAKPIIEYLNQWMVQHVDNPYPTPTEKAKIIADTGLTKRQVGDWMARSRKKLKAKSDSQQSINNNEPALTLSDDLTMMDSAQTNPTEIMLSDFRNRSSMSVQDIPVNSDKVTSVGENNAEENIFSTSPLLIDPGNSNKPTTIKEVETVLKTWLNSLEGNLFPTLAQKESLIQATGIDKKRLEGWFFRARKKIKNQESLNVINETTETNVTIESSASGSEMTLLNDHNPHVGPLASLPTSNFSVPLESELFTPQTSDVTANHESDLGSNSKGLTQEAKNYLSRWLSEHAANPYPSREEKDAMMSQLGISNERKLEGWFCRARKHQKKQHDNSIGQDQKNQKSEESTHMSTDSERPPSGGAGGHIDSINQMSESLLMGSPLLSSNFASLLSAAKSELSEEPWCNSRHSHAFNQGTGIESTTDQNMLSQHPVRMPTYYGAQQDFAPHYNADNSSNHRVIRASPSEHTQYQNPHGHYASDDYASYPESYPADYLSYGATYADNASNYSLQGHTMRASPADYMHESVQVQAHETANPSTNYAAYYRHDGDRQQAQRYSYPRPEHNDGSQHPGVDGKGFRQSQTYQQQ
jgi:hypothetical protein